MLRKLFGLGRSSDNSASEQYTRHGVDVQMNYCPSCGDEYRADVTMCASCSVELISGEARLAKKIQEQENFHSRSMEISETDQLVVIKEGKLRDIKPYQVLLSRQRIPALITGDSAGCGKG